MTMEEMMDLDVNVDLDLDQDPNSIGAMNATFLIG